MCKGAKESNQRRRYVYVSQEARWEGETMHLISPGPVRICPADPIDNPDLSLNARSKVHQVIDLFLEFRKYLSGHNAASRLPKDMDLTQEHTVVLV